MLNFERLPCGYVWSTVAANQDSAVGSAAVHTINSLYSDVVPSQR